ncbi:MAG: hypothetical protein IJR13_08030 [Bacteroidales bacterium]|nr:hypothetical protein [Bacteroidales bacterium]
MASTVINDHESIHAYRGKISNAIEKLEKQLRKTEMAVETVSASWQDSNFQEFRTNFEADKEPIRQLCNILRNYEGNLLYQLEEKLKVYKSGPTHL